MSLLFDRFAFLYDGFMQKTGLAGEERLLEHIGKVEGKRVADIGGGTGSLAVLLAGLKAEVVIVDPSASMTAIAEKKEQRIKVVRASAEEMPLAGISFDVVCMKDCLHHIVNRKKALNEAVRVLKPGGKMVILEFYPANLKAKLIFCFERLCSEKTWPVDPEVMKEILHGLGMKGKIYSMNRLEYVYVGCKDGENSALL